jgi:hypothetical protein
MKEPVVAYKPILWITVVCIWLLTACDAVVVPITLDAPDYDPVLNVQAFYLRGAKDEMLGRFTIVRSSFEPREQDDEFGHETPDPDIEVRLTRNQVLDLPFVSIAGQGISRVFTHRVAIIPPIATGEMVELHGSHPLFGYFGANQMMPEEVTLSKVRDIGVAGVNDLIDIIGLGRPTYGIEVTLADPPGSNFYQVSVSSDSGFTTPMIIRNPHFYDLFYDTYFFDDRTFDGQQFTFVIENLKPNDGYQVVFRNLTREWYEFELSIIEQVKPYVTRTISTSLFPGYTQPSLVRGNIDGALGCFGVGTERWYDIE